MTTPSSDFPISGGAPASAGTSGMDSLGVDDEDLRADETEGTEGGDGTDGTSDTTVGDAPDDPGGPGDQDDITNQDILSVDPDEYSDEPHMGSVPRPLGEEEYMPDTQGEDPIYAELGEEGQGDLAPEDM